MHKSLHPLQHGCSCGDADKNFEPSDDGSDDDGDGSLIMILMKNLDLSLNQHLLQLPKNELFVVKAQLKLIYNNYNNILIHIKILLKMIIFSHYYKNIQKCLLKQ